MYSYKIFNSTNEVYADIYYNDKYVFVSKRCKAVPEAEQWALCEIEELKKKGAQILSRYTRPDND